MRKKTIYSHNCILYVYATKKLYRISKDCIVTVSTATRCIRRKVKIRRMFVDSLRMPRILSSNAFLIFSAYAYGAAGEEIAD